MVYNIHRMIVSKGIIMSKMENRIYLYDHIQSKSEKEKSL